MHNLVISKVFTSSNNCSETTVVIATDLAQNCKQEDKISPQIYITKQQNVYNNNGSGIKHVLNFHA